MSGPPPDYDKDEVHHRSQSPPPQQYGHPIQNQPYMPGQVHMNQGFHPGPMMPPPQHTTTVILNQPTSVQNDRILGHRDGHREWSSGLFACFDDCGKCMYAWCCPSFVLAEVSSKLGECCCVTCCVPGGLATIRTRIRTLGGIRGSICKDYLVTEFCSMCALCQIQRELEYMGL